MIKSDSDLLRDRKLPQIVAHHLRLDLNLIELLATIYPDNTANHLRHHNHITQMRLDEIWLLIRLRLLFRFAQFLDQTHRPALEATVEPTTSACMNHIAELLGGEIKESTQRLEMVGLRRRRGQAFVLVKVDATV